jgi:hypothetical protein
MEKFQGSNDFETDVCWSAVLLIRSEIVLGHRTRHATPRYARLADERLESIVGRRRRDED